LPISALLYLAGLMGGRGTLGLGNGFVPGFGSGGRGRGPGYPGPVGDLGISNSFSQQGDVLL